MHRTIQFEFVCEITPATKTTAAAEHDYCCTVPVPLHAWLAALRLRQFVLYAVRQVPQHGADQPCAHAHRDTHRRRGRSHDSNHCTSDVVCCAGNAAGDELAHRFSGSRLHPGVRSGGVAVHICTVRYTNRGGSTVGSQSVSQPDSGRHARQSQQGTSINKSQAVFVLVDRNTPLQSAITRGAGGLGAIC